MANRRWKDSLKILRCRKNLEKDHVKWLTLDKSLSLNHPQSLQYEGRFSKKNIEPKSLQVKALLPSSYPKFGSLWYAEPWRLRQMDNNVRKILKLAKSMNHGNYEIVLKKKSELIQLVEEFHNQYQSLHFFNKDTREKEKQDVTEEDKASSFSYSSESEGSEIYYTPKMSIINSGHSSSERDCVASEAGSPLAEEIGEVVKEAFYVEPVSLSSKVEKADVDGLISEFNLLREELDEKEKEILYLAKACHVREVETSEKIKELDCQVDTLESQLEILNIQNQDLKYINTIKDNEVKRICEENLIIKDRISELEQIIEEKGDEIYAVLKNFNDNEKLLMDSLSFQERKLELLLSQTGKGSDEILVLQQELEKKTHEMSEFLKLADSLKEELQHKTADEKNMAEEMNSLRIQIQDLEMQLNSLGEPKGINEVKQLIFQNEKQSDKIFLLEAKLKEKEDEISTIQEKNETDHGDIKLQQICDFLQTEKEAETQLEREKEMNRMHVDHRQAKGIADINSTEDINDQEEEILGTKDKIRKLENRVGELEKMVIENEEDVQVLKEEKREAIRQLCVWQDYHFSRYDLLKKAFSELIARNQDRAR
ncbi:NAB domain-containing protein [Heracleum sosnowskyi]|uniref:NAB domain-containing protein n=1 Tax=Heracleum sosnowskyi TaxID=360622 RepID=A0AAD8MDP7_9APIA|nr:NAB domain-containing protein [Heracleum sosnowskyi]